MANGTNKSQKGRTKSETTVSPLESFKENARQLNEAKEYARNNTKASILEFKDMTGKVFRYYWNGATYTDRKSSLYERERKGIYKAKFKAPKEWG